MVLILYFICLGRIPQGNTSERGADEDLCCILLSGWETAGPGAWWGVETALQDGSWTWVSSVLLGSLWDLGCAGKVLPEGRGRWSLHLLSLECPGTVWTLRERAHCNKTEPGPLFCPVCATNINVLSNFSLACVYMYEHKLAKKVTICVF